MARYMLNHAPSLLPPLSSFLSFILLPPRMLPAGSREQAQAPARGGAEVRRGHHWHARWPARALPRPGAHAPISDEPLGGVGGRSAKARGDALLAAAGRMLGVRERAEALLLSPAGSPFLALPFWLLPSGFMVLTSSPSYHMVQPWRRPRRPPTILSCPGDGLVVLLAFGPVVTTNSSWPTF